MAGTAPTGYLWAAPSRHPPPKHWRLDPLGHHPGHDDERRLRIVGNLKAPNTRVEPFNNRVNRSKAPTWRKSCDHQRPVRTLTGARVQHSEGPPNVALRLRLARLDECMKS
jgi:hypothetical protein